MNTQEERTLVQLIQQLRNVQEQTISLLRQDSGVPTQPATPSTASALDLNRILTLMEEQLSRAGEIRELVAEAAERIGSLKKTP